MRIINHKFTVRSVLFSRPMAILYAIILCIFAYKSLMLVPVWLTVKDKSHQALDDYQKKVAEIDEKKQNEENKETDLGKERYQKDFFNKLDEGENLIVLYGDVRPEESKMKDRKMFWWEEWKQNYLVWWRNLEIKKSLSK